jgi:hypothetical protein
LPSSAYEMPYAECLCCQMPDDVCRMRMRSSSSVRQSTSVFVSLAQEMPYASVEKIDVTVTGLLDVEKENK